jgi:uncharacterized protein (DUF1778 family)
MKLTPEQVREILEQAKPEIIAGLKAEVIQSARWDLSQEAAKLVKTEVEQFIAAEIIPIVKQNLIESKEGLISLVAPMTEQIMVALANELAQQAKKNLEQSYKRREIFKALFE